MDTICIFPDALIAVQDSNDYYCIPRQNILDSLIVFGADSILKSKGYATTTFKSGYNGWFTNPLLKVPVKKPGDDFINMEHLPQSYEDTMGVQQKQALQKLCNQIYLRVTSNGSKFVSEKLLKTNVELDSGTIKLLGNKDFVLFVFHQAYTRSPELDRRTTLSMLHGMAILGGIAGIGIAGIGIAGGIAGSIEDITKREELKKYRSNAIFPLYNRAVQTFHTYTVLYQLSSKSILWSNYSSANLGIKYNLYEICTNPTPETTKQIFSDTVKELSIYKWKWNHLVHFPEKTESRFFKNKYSTVIYPFLTYFQKMPSTIVKDSLVDFKYIRCIDSTLSDISLNVYSPTKDQHSQSSIPLSDPTSTRVRYWKSNLSFYLQYAYYQRLKYSPYSDGALILCLTTTQEGFADQIWIENSSLNDTTFENAIIEIVKKYDFNLKGVRAKQHYIKIPLEFSIDNPQTFQIKSIYSF
jgi:hypothetical protein